MRNAHWSGFFFGYSQFIRFGFIAFVFYIASKFICDYKSENPKDTYIGVYILFVAALGTGFAMASAPSVGKAKESARQVFEIIEEKSLIDSRDTTGEKVIEHGAIELRNTEFIYPSRTERVLKKMNMKIPATRKIALVGHSGCGKSTITNLLLRMYELTGG